MLSDKQRQAIKFFLNHENVKNYDGVLDAGAIRAGKSYSGIQAFVYYSQAFFQGFQKKRDRTKQQTIHLISGKSATTIRNNVIRPLQDMYGVDNCKYSEKYGELIVGDHLYRCVGAKNVDSVDNIRGATIACWYADEVTTQHQEFVNYAMGRLTVDGARFFWNCNPESPYHHIYTDFVQAQKEKKLMYRHWLMSDNPSLSEDYKARMARQMTGVFYRRYILGEWCVAEGVIYPDFEQQAEFISTSAVPHCDYYVVGIDYGITNPQVYGFIGYKTGSDGKVHEYVIDEYYHADKRGNETDNYYIEELKRFVEGRPIRYYIIDPSATSFIHAMRSSGIHNIRQADNTVLDGLQNHAKWLAEGRVHVVKANCPNYIKEHGVYSWDAKAQARGIDEPLKVSDHAMDGMARYPKQTLYPLRGRVQVYK